MASYPGIERWRGKVALVTGASCGIGYDLSKRLCELGMNVVGCARTVDTIQVRTSNRTPLPPARPFPKIAYHFLVTSVCSLIHHSLHLCMHGKSGRGVMFNSYRNELGKSYNLDSGRSVAAQPFRDMCINEEG